MKTIYALLVGIDDYPAPVPRLRGCINDVRATRQLLEAQVDPSENTLRIRVLENQQAAREPFLRAFREHLGQAVSGDVALFWFSGHGSQEQAPEEFWKVEPDRLDETLVLYDSRTAGSWDLADKELAALIAVVADKGAHVAVVLDCCHSGSGTRSLGIGATAVRRAPTDLRRRPFESFIFADKPLEESGTRGMVDRPSGWRVGVRHVLLAGCRDDEEAKEYQAGGVSRGAFSYFLGETLRTGAHGLTYRSLFDRAAAIVRANLQRQSPQLEATIAGDLDRPFLGGAIRPATRSFLAVHQAGRWTIDVGRVHGIENPTPDGGAEIALFAGETADEDLQDLSKALARARVSRALGTTSELEIVQGEADPARAPLRAALLGYAAPRLRVRLEGEPAGLGPVRRVLTSSRFVREVVGDEGADMRLIARDGEYLIARPGDDRPLVDQIQEYSDGSARRVVERLEHIERWQATAQLTNPSTTIAPDELRLEVIHAGHPLSGSEFRLEYTPEGDDWVNPEVTIRVKNTGRRSLYVGLVDLPQTFGIFPMLNHVGSQRLDPGQETFVNDAEPVQLTVPEAFWERGITEIKDLVKVIVSTSEFDARRLAQPDLDVPRVESRSGARAGHEPTGTLERLMDRVQTRHAGSGPARRIDDWRTLELTFTTSRPLPAGRLVANQALTLPQGVRVEAHPAFAAKAVRLACLPPASRAPGAHPLLPRMIYEDPGTSEPFELAPARAVSNILNVLELSGVNDPALVTAEHPLALTISQPLGAGETVLPIAFDGEFFMPLGNSESTAEGTRVVLERLPQPDAAQSRSLGGSLRIVLQKVISGVFGTEYHYPILAATDLNDDLSVRYDADARSVRRRVAAANRIALFVHGIIGDTREMASSLRRAGAAGQYDLVLTFDYENLHDPIGDTARALKERLAAVGLADRDDKVLDVFAHSMGGLVSRYFIEREGGSRVVDRLVMLGTPNGGSPWPAVKSWATTALAIGLNEVGKVAWPAKLLAGLVRATKLLDVTLGEMTPGSAFLQELAASPDPAIPYFLIAGDTSAIPSPADAEAARRTRLDRLLKRLWPDDVKYQAANLLFGGSANDIAVSLTSMQELPRGREKPCEVLPVPCDHLSYFTDPAGLATLVRTLGA